MIVAVIARREPADIRAALEALSREPGLRQGLLAEVRLDAMAVPDGDVVRGASVPVLATCRRPIDGGSFRGPESARFDLLRAAAAAGAAYVDIERDAAAAFGRPPAPTKLVVSHHDFDGLVPDVRGLVRGLLSLGGDVVKLAARLRCALDVMTLSRATGEAPGRVVAFGLGSAGLVTRLLPERFGSPWTYARYSVEPNAALPAELPTFRDVVDLYAVRPSGPAPEAAYAVLGDRAEQSVGPAAWNRVFRDRGVPARYVPFSTSSTTGVREVCRLLGIRGLSVTTPHKVAALALADEIHPRAREVGAANTLVNEGGVWTAYNTDVDGFARPIRAAFAETGRSAHGASAVVVGLGGAGFAAASALRAEGFRTTLVSRRSESVGTSPLGPGVTVLAPADVPRAAADVVVNATPTGSVRDPAGRAVDLGWAKAGAVVFETNYRPRATPLTIAARAAGFRVLDGVDLYVAQAIAQLRLFRTDCDDAEGALRTAVEHALVPGA